VVIEADASVGAQWRGILDDLRAALHGHDDLDRGARVRLAARRGSVEVQVVLPDGRHAERSIRRREDVVPTIEGLLLVPQPSVPAAALAAADVAPDTQDVPPPATPESPVGPASQPEPEVRSNRGLADRDAMPHVPADRPERLRIELSVVTGARIGADRQGSVGIGAMSFLDISGWLLGFEGRADRYKTLDPPPPGTGKPPPGGALELAVLGGRRLRFGTTSLDLVAGPAAALQGTTTFQTQSPGTGNVVSESSSSTVPRLVLGVRLNFGARSSVRWFVGLDGELGPGRADNTDVPDAPHLPIWTAGLAFGATVGTL
jgi:hypothetical protein